MAALRAGIAVIALVAMAAPAHADQVARWRPYIDDASTRFGIPARWIERVMRAESAGKTVLDGRPITSRAGAMGLMQLMPGTWAEMRARLGLGSNPHDPHDNILAGTLYLRLMYDRFGYPGVFAAYNAGPQRYAEFLAERRSLPSETRVYLAKVAGGIQGEATAFIERPPSSMFFPVGVPSAPAPRSTPGQAAKIFIVLGRPAPSR